VLGLPDAITACLFDLDGVLTKTDEVHARAWKQAFDAFLKTRAEEPFDAVRDYDEHVDVDRSGRREALRAHGASVVVDDLAELL
jgi:phosphoglycolate phosphatase-like HAD superfamily hydrolase